MTVLVPCEDNCLALDYNGEKWSKISHLKCICYSIDYMRWKLPMSYYKKTYEDRIDCLLKRGRPFLLIAIDKAL